jgi:hypothetical protein
MAALLVTLMNRCLPWQDRFDGYVGRCILVIGNGLRGQIAPVTSFPV